MDIKMIAIETLLVAIVFLFHLIGLILYPKSRTWNFKALYVFGLGFVIIVFFDLILCLLGG